MERELRQHASNNEHSVAAGNTPVAAPKASCVDALGEELAGFVMLTEKIAGVVEGLDLSTWVMNRFGIVLYSGIATSRNIHDVAGKLGISPENIVLPTKAQSRRFYDDEGIRRRLLSRDIWWVLSIKSGDDRPVSLAEYWKNPRGFIFCGCYLPDGKLYDDMDDMISHKWSAVIVKAR